MKKMTVAVAGIVCLVLAGSLRAGVKVGDRPAFDVTALDGSQLTLQKYRGKIIVVDFWATWCGPCMAEADHMVALNNEYGPKGVQIIGVSLDEDQSALKKVIKSKGFVWPQFFDGGGWGNALAKEWGVQSIPATFIINPEGAVVWKGHPANIDSALAAAFAKTPPSAIDPAIAKEADAKLAEIEAKLKDAPDQALALLGSVPAEASKVDGLKKRLEQCQSALAPAAQGVIAEADKLTAQNQFTDAAAKLQIVITAMPETDAGKNATAKLKAMESNPEYIKQKQAAEQAKIDAKRQEEAQAMTKNAESLAAEKRHEEAYGIYKNVVRDYDGTPAAKVARDAVAAYEKDPAFMRKLHDRMAQEQAEPMLSLARNYARTNPDMAKRKYGEIIRSFPDTTYADTAKKELAALEAKSKKK